MALFYNERQTWQGLPPIGNPRPAGDQSQQFGGIPMPPNAPMAGNNPVTPPLASPGSPQTPAMQAQGLRAQRQLPFWGGLPPIRRVNV